MHVAELWRYPVKSLRGERLQSAAIGYDGLAGDRRVLVVDRGRIVTARTRPALLALQGGLAPDGTPTIAGFDWRSSTALALVKDAAGDSVELVAAPDGAFDVLPLSVATDGAAAFLGIDGRRLRPNIVVGDVDGLDERTWVGKVVLLGEVRAFATRLRPRCVMTTWHPDTQAQDLSVLHRIVSELDGTASLDCAVEAPGVVTVGAAVTLSGRERVATRSRR